MLLEDVIYIGLLLGCIGFGSIYRTVTNNINRKRWIGSSLGVILVVVVSGLHAVHIILSFGVATLIILVFDVRQAHVLTFLFMFGYLLFFRTTEYLNIPSPPSHTNMVQMMVTLKMVGLAFERNTAAKDLLLENKKTFANEDDRSISAIKKAYLEDVLDLNVEDIFHYCFNYLGVLIGPYYSYRTFRDYFTARYFQFVNCELLMMQRLKWILIYAAFILSCSYIWPITYALTDEFYMERSVLYRLWYVLPSFFIFRMRIYIGLTLAECTSIMAGFGAYPEEFKSRPGGGPRDIVALDKPVAESKFDFETIHTFDAETSEQCVTVREAMHSYQMCLQYWLATVSYHRFPIRSLRTFATMAVSAFWHGLFPGYFVSLLGVPFFLPVESIWDRLLRQSAKGTKRRLIDAGFWLAKTFALSYLGMAFLLMSYENILNYYQSVYHFGILWGVVMFVVGLLWSQQVKMSVQKDRNVRARTPAAQVQAVTETAPASPPEEEPIVNQPQQPIEASPEREVEPTNQE